MKYPKLAAITALSAALSTTTSAQTIVDTELLLLVDVSGSISGSSYNLMIDGYANAFRQSSIIDAIESGANDSIAVSLAFWSGSSQQTVGVGWTQISDSASANAFADAIASTSRPYSSLTAVGSAIQWGAQLFGTETGGSSDNGFTSAFQVIDVSGDGQDNDSPGGTSGVQAARDTALANGVDMINGLPVGAGSLNTYYRDNVIGGSIDGNDAFTQFAGSFADFEETLTKKLTREITIAGEGGNGGAVPEPSSALLSALAGTAFLLRRRRK